VLERTTTATFRKRGIEGIQAPLVGRTLEWGQLSSTAESVLRGFGQIVFLVGEAGLGKSRLIHELSETLEDDVDWYETTSLSFETNHPYGLVQRLLRRICVATPNDSPEELRNKIEKLIDTLAPAEQPLCQKAFESLFGMTGRDGAPPLEGETFRNRLHDAFKTFFQQQTHLKPVVLVCDDLHWTDAASLTLLEYLFELIDALPIMLLCATRPETGSPGWQLKSRAAETYANQFIEIHLQPLNQHDSNELVDKLLSASDLPPEVRKIILNQSEGIPFFVEEVVRELIESGAVWLDESGAHWVPTENGNTFDIPDNLQALLIARIDRLDESTRRVLQLAALIGRSFHHRVLSMIVQVGSGGMNLEKELERLQQANFIETAVRSDEREYMFPPRIPPAGRRSNGDALPGPA
jgi:predicted ATPase